MQGLSFRRGYGGLVLRQGVPWPTVPLEIFLRASRMHTLSALHSLSLFLSLFLPSSLLSLYFLFFFFFYKSIYLVLVLYWWDFLRGSDGKESACQAVGAGSIPESGRSSGEGNGYSRQYFCLENSMDRGAWWPTVHGVAKGLT